MDVWAEGRLAGRCAAVVPVQVPLRCQQAKGVGVGVVGVAGVQGLTEAHYCVWTDYGLRSVSTGCRRCRVGRVWQSERRSGRRAGDALECPAGRAGRAGGWVSTDGKAAAVWCLSCACERRAKCQCLCCACAVPGRSAELWYERTATGSCREPEPEPDLRPHSARPRPRPRRRSRAPRWPRERAAAAASIHLASPHQRPYLHHHQCKHHHHHQQRKHQQHRQRKHHHHHQRKHQQHRQRKHHHHHHTAAPTMATEAPLPVEAAAHDAPPQPEPAADTAPKPVKRSWR